MKKIEPTVRSVILVIERQAIWIPDEVDYKKKYYFKTLKEKIQLVILTEPHYRGTIINVRCMLSWGFQNTWRKFDIIKGKRQTHQMESW